MTYTPRQLTNVPHQKGGRLTIFSGHFSHQLLKLHAPHGQELQQLGVQALPVKADSQSPVG